MRARVATALGLTAITVLALPACSTEGAKASPTFSPPAGKPASTTQNAAPLSSVDLNKRLLNESDLGSDYRRKPENPLTHDDVTIVGCPALTKLGGDAAIGGTLDFPRQAKATFTYASGVFSEISEELYNDTAADLSDGFHQIFNAMTGCPTYQVIAGSTKINMASQKMTAPQLGDEQWSQLLTYSVSGRDILVKQTAIRAGTVLLVVSGSPALVDRHLDKALAKATATR